MRKPRKKRTKIKRLAAPRPPIKKGGWAGSTVILSRVSEANDAEGSCPTCNPTRSFDCARRAPPQAAPAKGRWIAEQDGGVCSDNNSLVVMQGIVSGQRECLTCHVERSRNISCFKARSILFPSVYRFAPRSFDKLRMTKVGAQDDKENIKPAQNRPCGRALTQFLATVRHILRLLKK